MWAADAIASLRARKAPAGGWLEAMPTWIGVDNRRGLQPWGPRVFKKKKNHSKWNCKGLCSLHIQDGMKFVYEKLGLPPVVTGTETCVLEIYWIYINNMCWACVHTGQIPKGGKNKKKRNPTKNGGNGHTRGQVVLTKTKNPIDLYTIFIYVLRSYYCFNLDPPVDDGTDASDAVMHYMLMPVVSKRLLSSMKLRLQKISNKKLCMRLAEPLWDWVRPGDTDDTDSDRLNILVSLGPKAPSEDEGEGEGGDEDNGEEFDQGLVKECHTLIVEMWLEYSKGKPVPKDVPKDADEEAVEDEGEHSTPKKTKLRKKPTYPYGVAASWNNDSFKEVPPAFFAATLSTLYPFVVMPKEGKLVSHMAHITNT